jgi:hypothetical protein
MDSSRDVRAAVGMGLVALLLAATACRPTPPCAREMAVLRQREALRIHGLTENDDVSQAMARLQSAARCAREEDGDSLRAHALLLRSRLEARGATDQLVALNQLLHDVGVETESSATVRRAADHAGDRLEAYAAAMKVAAGDSDAELRAQLAFMALGSDRTAVFPHVTRALVNHSHSTEGCFTVVNHQELPAGTAVVSLQRAAKGIPLHGESPTFGVSKGKPRVVRLCTDGPLLGGDVVQISVGGEVVWQQVLAVTPDDQVRGALRRNFADGDVTTLCAGVKEHSAKVACALASARRVP